MRRTLVALGAFAVIAGQATAQSTPAQPQPYSGSAQAPVSVSPPPPAVAPVDAALKAAVLATGTGPESTYLRAFYAQRNYERAWSREDETVLLNAINDAERHGLNPRDFLPPAGATDAIQRDIRLTRAAMAYGSALSFGRIDPTTQEDIWTLRGHTADLPTGLNSAIRTHGLQPWIDQLAPTDRGYQGLTTAFLRYRDIATRGGWPAWRPGVKVEPGANDARIPALAARLVAEGDLTPEAAITPAGVSPQTYNPTLVAAVKKFQTRHGLGPDGVIGDDTQVELQATAKDRMRQIATNMERRRWLARDLAPERIEVNVAAAILVYWRDGKPFYGTRVVPGATKTQTPSLEAPFNSVVANPPWNVPAGIAAKEIIPKGAGYMAARGMYMTGGRVVQRPGPNSALGLVKFEVNNPYAIYLHDTPSKRFFANTNRHLSHGCIRVQDAVAFARMVLGFNPEALAQFDAAQASGQTTRVMVGRTIPVRLLYWTAFLDGDGRISFRKDVYGRDDKLAKALGLGSMDQLIEAQRPVAGDVGP
ncbi:MAG: L,D-transpeptidase family protein [Caulobacteraceae bacterium]|nr:L,D-transpeptidase family protein [Caulobacteraceae bacterium]